MSAFGPAAEPRTIAWCNLCRAEGKDFELDPADPAWMQRMQRHSEVRHPEHEAALRRGETYEPVEVAP